jgi:acetylornithine/succinyldiaminopimelate/putrescine aminotransferase
MGALSLIDRLSHRQGFGPFLDNCIVLPYNEIPPLREEIRHDTAAVIVEVIQGEGGIRPASPEFLEELGRLHSETGCLLILDEVQTGMGRTGKFLSFQYTQLKPDLILLAKALGGGFPLGAILGSERVADVLHPGSHGSTFGGNPVACAAGVAVVRELTDGGVLGNVVRVGEKFRERLEALRRKFPELVLEIRGRGLMIGIELAFDAELVSGQLREKGILVNVTDKVVLRVVPPLTIDWGHVEVFLAGLEEVLAEQRPARSY